MIYARCIWDSSRRMIYVRRWISLFSTSTTRSRRRRSQERLLQTFIGDLRVCPLLIRDKHDAPRLPAKLARFSARDPRAQEFGRIWRGRISAWRTAIGNEDLGSTGTPGGRVSVFGIVSYRDGVTRRAICYRNKFRCTGDEFPIVPVYSLISLIKRLLIAQK